MQGEEAQPEYLVGHEQMPDVGAGEPGARRATAIGVEWPRIGAVIATTLPPSRTFTFSLRLGRKDVAVAFTV